MGDNQKDNIEINTQEVVEDFEMSTVDELTGEGVSKDTQIENMPVNPTVKTFNIESLNEEVVQTEVSYSFFEYIKAIFRNPLQNLPKSCNKYSFGILFEIVVTLSILMVLIMNKVIEDRYFGYRGFMKFETIRLVQSQVSSRVLTVIISGVFAMFLFILLEKLMSKWLLKEHVNYLDLVAKYGQIALLPSIFVILSAVFFFLEAPQRLIIVVLAMGMMVFNISQLGQMILRAKDAKNSKVAPVYFVAIVQSLILVIVSIFMNVG